MEISVVIPVFDEAEGLPALYGTLCTAPDALPHPAEVVKKGTKYHAAINGDGVPLRFTGA